MCELDYVFKSFSNDKGMQIGLEIIKIVKEMDKSVAIVIEKNKTIIFLHLMDGAQEENLFWAKRKSRVTDIFGKSSKLVGEIYKSKGKDFSLMYEPNKYQAVGGSIPIFIENTGMIGSITISGLSSIEDHEVILKAIKNIEKSEKF